MTKDFAGRTSRAAKPKKHVQKRKPAAPARVFFHGPSFTTGALVGAAIVILAAYAPDYLSENSKAGATSVTTAADQAGPTQPMQFDFPDMLRDTEVLADPEPYAVPSTSSSDQPDVWHIQAASFREKADADALRARLLLDNLPATTEVSSANGSQWHRVVLGPFARRVDANRAMTRLREQGISGMWLNNHN
ncbi:MAG: SPOR domain-containing protein [Pseudomonadales bacterium]|jgi:cell division protein FtsN|nr:SPOR domain-containing protein [Pseudomonadales bacterium]